MSRRGGLKEGSVLIYEQILKGAQMDSVKKGSPIQRLTAGGGVDGLKDEQWKKETYFF